MTVYQQISSNKRRSILLIVGFIGFIIIFGWIIGSLLDYGYLGLFFAIIFATVLSLISYYTGDKIALWSAGAKGPLAKEDNPYIYRLVENLCLTAGLPIPKIYLIPDESMNAFATGRQPKVASIALTTGLIQNLTNEELEGVIAHELSHIKNYDIRLMMVVIICVGIITLITDFIFHSFGAIGGKKREQAGLLLVISLLLWILSPLIAKLIQLAISRKREYLADASAVLLTRYPEGLATALEKIAAQSRPLAQANQAIAHLYIANPFAGSRKFFSRWFSTHPPIAERVAKLRSIA